jgi:hypothetical protein
MTQPDLPPVPQLVPYDAPRPAVRYVYRVSWGGTLVLACLALGLCGSAIQIERAQVARERAHMAALAAASSLLESQQEDLGKLLADPQTRLVALHAADAAAIGQATFAWNDHLQQGAIFCDHLPVSESGLPYVIQAYNGSSSGPASPPVQIGSLQVRPGVSVYFFQSTSAVQPVRRIEVVPPGNAVASQPMLYATISD